MEILIMSYQGGSRVSFLPVTPEEQWFRLWSEVARCLPTSPSQSLLRSWVVVTILAGWPWIFDGCNSIGFFGNTVWTVSLNQFMQEDHPEFKFNFICLCQRKLWSALHQKKKSKDRNYDLKKNINTHSTKTNSPISILKMWTCKNYFKAMLKIWVLFFFLKTSTADEALTSLGRSYNRWGPQWPRRVL